MSRMLMGALGAVWDNFYRLMLEQGWLCNTPACYKDLTDKHSLIIAEDGNWLLTDERWFDETHQSGHVQMTWSDTPVFTASYDGQVYKPEELEFVKTAIRSSYHDPDFFGFRGPESFPADRNVPDGEFYYSNCYSKDTLVLFGDFEPRYRWLCGIGEEALMRANKKFLGGSEEIASNTWWYMVRRYNLPQIPITPAE